MLAVGFGITWLMIGVGCCCAYLLLQMHGRLLIRLDALERELVISRLQSLTSKTDTANEKEHTNSDDESLKSSRIIRSGINVGERAPDFSLDRVDMPGKVSLSQFAGREFLLIFAAPECGPCNKLMERLSLLSLTAIADSVLLIGHGSVDQNKAKCDKYALPFPMAVQHHWQVSRKYGTFKLPSAYLVNADGIIDAPLAIGPEPIMKLVSLLLGQRASTVSSDSVAERMSNVQSLS